MGWQFPPFYGKSKKFYEKKIAKNNTKIAKLQEENAYCEEQLKNGK